jgi:hypothetical protein
MDVQNMKPRLKLAGKYSKKEEAMRKGPENEIGFWGRKEQEGDNDDSDGEDDAREVTEETEISKKKTPKERRSADVAVKNENKISITQKRNFKENFNTDKTRLDKRQTKLDRAQDFLLLVKDNIHEASGGSKTASGWKSNHWFDFTPLVGYPTSGWISNQLRGKCQNTL